jgi:hypothetical protein
LFTTEPNTAWEDEKLNPHLEVAGLGPRLQLEKTAGFAQKDLM